MIIGLGNPGRKYKNTRHNLGFMVLDELARRWRLRFSRSHLLFENIQKSEEPYAALLLKPMTYMNRSGDAIREMITDPDFRPDRMLVVLDDFALPLGKIRVRSKGSDGGHNGLSSIIEVIGHSDFPRLRLGIGFDGTLPVMDYVLSPFSRKEKPIVRNMIDKGADAVLDFLENDIHHTMNFFN